MQENPYSSILSTIRRDADQRSSSPWRLGEVESVDPLVIKTADQYLADTDLLVNYQLRENTETVDLSEIGGVLYGSVDCPEGSISSMSVSDGQLACTGLFGGVLEKRDQVVLLQSDDGQQFVVLCKVVKA